MPLKLISINIEGDKHLNRVVPFLKKERPDVVCLQELYAVDVPLFEKELGMTSSFVPLVRMEAENKYGFSLKGLFGIGMFTALDHHPPMASFYRGDPQALAVFGPPNSLARSLLTMEVEKEDTLYPIGTTHFTWSPGGKATDEQMLDAQKLLALVERYPELILCGDFNAPRGNAIHELFAMHLQDCIPPEITSTLDPHLHYAGKLDLVVDYVFSKGKVSAEGVRVVSGVSDHCAIVSDIV